MKALVILLLLLSPVAAEDFLTSDQLYISGRIVPYFTGDERVSALAEQIAAGSTSVREAAFKINSWIRFKGNYTKEFKYWKSDVEVLNQNVTGVCLDFAGLEVGMLRSLNIPSRVIYATLDQIEGHAWVEFFDGERWIQADPTFGTFDSERYYCYLGYDILELYTVVDGELTTMDKLGYTSCEQKHDYLDVIVWAPLTIVMILAAGVLLHRHIREQEEAELEQAEKEGEDWL